MKRPNSFKCFVTFLFLGAAAFAQTRPAATEPSSVTPANITRLAGDVYAGAERCNSCHRAESQQFNKTHHSHLKLRKDAVAGCEMCHGGGKAHADAMEAAQGDEAKTAGASATRRNCSGPTIVPGRKA